MNKSNVNPSSQASTKTKHYLKYAIGEIILVVIGILIALQINNWNENRNAKIEEDNILTALLEDIKTAEKNCQSDLDRELKNIKPYEKILGNEISRKSILNHPSIDSLFYEILWAVGSDPSTISAIGEIQNSGNSAKISNKSIRKQIAALDAQLHKVETIVRDRLAVQQLSIDKFAFDIENFSKLLFGQSSKYNINFGSENNYESLINNHNFLNAMAIKLDLCDSVIEDRKQLMTEIKTLIALITKELNIKEDA